MVTQSLYAAIEGVHAHHIKIVTWIQQFTHYYQQTFIAEQNAHLVYNSPCLSCNSPAAVIMQKQMCVTKLRITHTGRLI